jgi:hypothetical protein
MLRTTRRGGGSAIEEALVNSKYTHAKDDKAWRWVSNRRVTNTKYTPAKNNKE